MECIRFLPSDVAIFVDALVSSVEDEMPELKLAIEVFPAKISISCRYRGRLTNMDYVPLLP